MVMQQVKGTADLYYYNYMRIYDYLKKTVQRDRKEMKGRGGPLATLATVGPAADPSTAATM